MKNIRRLENWWPLSSWTTTCPSWLTNPPPYFLTSSSSSSPSKARWRCPSSGKNSLTYWIRETSVANWFWDRTRLSFESFRYRAVESRCALVCSSASSVVENGLAVRIVDRASWALSSVSGSDICWWYWRCSGDPRKVLVILCYWGSRGCPRVGYRSSLLWNRWISMKQEVEQKW